jgi:putative ABC transport system substrate-binding protein
MKTAEAVRLAIPPPVVLVLVLALAVVAAPLAAGAQQASKPHRIGYLHVPSAPTPSAPNVPFETFRRALRKRGYVEGRNLVIESRWAGGKPERLPGLAAELVRLEVEVLVVVVCGAPLDAARQATSTIPIVVAVCNEDLVRTGVVKSLAEPGGNVTGVSKMTPELAAKRLELLKEVSPGVSRVAVLWPPAHSDFSADWTEMQRTARVLGVTLQSVEFRGPEDFDGAFTMISTGGADGLLTFSDAITYYHGRRIVELAARHRLPAMYPFRELVDAGGLISYGPDILALFPRAAAYVDKILKGAKPADLPVEQPTKFELVVNLKTAKALGLVIPPSVLVRADEIIY